MILWEWGDGRREVWLAASVAPLLAVSLGVYLVFAPQSAIASPVFDTARDVMPVKAWGVLFAVKGVAAIAAFLARSWLALYRVMVAGMGLYVVWAVLSGWTAVFNNWQGAVGAALWGWAAFTHYLIRRSFLNQYRVDHLAP